VGVASMKNKSMQKEKVKSKRENGKRETGEDSKQEVNVRRFMFNDQSCGY
jgi:hypothetical protein